MKISTLFIACLLILSSCSSDDAETKVSENILGTWIGTNVSLSGEIETVNKGQTILTTIIGEGYDLTNKLIFTDAPNFVASEGNLNMELSYTVNGVTITENIEDFELLVDGTWEINGSDLIITDPDETIDEDAIRAVNIFKLTDNALIIKITETEEEIEDGVVSTSSIEILASYVKQ